MNNNNNHEALSLPETTGHTENMTGTEKTDCFPARQRKPEENGETTWVDDDFDESYKEKDSSVPPRQIVWRNVVLMALLHTGALYGLTVVPSAQALTLLWGAFALYYSMHQHFTIEYVMLYSAVCSGGEAALRCCPSVTHCPSLSNRD